MINLISEFIASIIKHFYSVLNLMYRLGLVDILVTNGVWPNFLVWSPPWLYASAGYNKTKPEKTLQNPVKIPWDNIDGP